jgi:C4-type Zn-finger protein
MTILFSYYYSLICSKCGVKIADVSPTLDGTTNHHCFTVVGGCPNCGETTELNVVSSVAKIYKE